MVESQAPVLEMLWESREPGHTLGSRFGFSDGAAAGRWVAGTLDKHWGVRIDSCERIVMSAGNALAWVATPSGRLLAKWSVVPGIFPHLAETARLTSWLHERGLPVSAPVAARDGRLQIEVDGVSIGVQREIVGGLLDTADSGQVRAAGAVLARLQQELAAYPDAGRLPGAAGPFPPLADRITGWLDSSAGHLPPAARDTLRGLVAAAPADRSARQLVHFDFRSANILWHRGEIAAILDFEEARHEHRIVDLARAAVLLGTRYHDWGPVPAAVHAEFRAGYESERVLTPAEADWLDILLLWQCLAMVPAGDDPTGWGPAALSRLPRP
ncbi:phosphotransferase [Actinoplanes xinjiangensis]|uniref:Homoserine kinase type II n=1 Tax=Actinoplanes xinjiangensis TaxID=512350 RepID=A0A316FKA1_9ACTN|nr:phosphotransferase [Actinoplanes xinjiangensis]PWK48210.1 homoserine kinase type II [Actinoplanes xinjiangensis]GIF39037.1 homoserine kinase type II (protein kinase fold) [Actinoplanes xinjiangensis]